MKRMSVVIVAAVSALLLTGCSSKTELTSAQARIDQLENQVDELESKLEIEQARAAELNAELAKSLAKFKEKEQVWLEQQNMNSIVTVSDAVLFESGSVHLSPTGREIVSRIASAASQYPKREIRVEGHTDDRPIGPSLSSKYPTNWELSTGRACSIIHFMSRENRVKPTQLAAIGYGPHRPIGDNKTAEGRAKNRRVVIVIGPQK